MGCQISKKLLEQAIEFHGHNCPGLTIGIRVAEYALQEFEGVDPADLVCVTETDMCGVDGVQFLTECTFGKGNLIHRDFGKAAFSFYDRKGGKALRFVLKKDAKKRNGEDVEGKDAIIDVLLAKDLDEIFTKAVIDSPPPRSARVLQSLLCESCGEETMESRTRRFAGKTMCIPCFDQVEQKQ